jgi:cobalt-zinc-cadmium efflux system outer membrane protein
VKNAVILAIVPGLLANLLLAQQPVAPLRTAIPGKITASSPDPIRRPKELPVDAAESAPIPLLTLARTQELALRSNPSLAQAAARVDAAWGQLVQSGLYPNTIIGYHANEVGNYGGPGVQGGFIRQQIITGGKMRLNRALARHELEIAEVDLTVQEQRVLNDVNSRFFEMLVAQQRLTLTQELVRISEAFVQSTETLLKAGRVNENNLLQAQLESDNAHILRDNAGNIHHESWRRLRAVIGDPGLPMQSAEGNLAEKAQEFSWKQSLQDLLTDHPELTMARIEIDRAYVALQQACRKRYPNIDVMLSVRHHNVTSDDVANIQVGFPLPLFDRNQGNIFKAQSELAAAESRLQKAELNLRDQLATTFRRYANSRQQVERYQQQMLPRAQRSLDFVTRGYRQGQVDFLTLLTSQRTYYQVNLQYLDALRNLRLSEIMMDGHLLQGSLQIRSLHNR